MPKQHQQTGTHIQTAAHLSHKYTTVVFTAFFSQAVSARESNCFFVILFFFLLALKPDQNLSLHPNKSTDKHRTNKTVQHTTKHSYLHPHPQECPPDNKSSVSDQGSCHRVVLILRQKSQSHMSLFLDSSRAHGWE